MSVSPTMRISPALFVQSPMVPEIMMSSGIRLRGPLHVMRVMITAMMMKTGTQPLDRTHGH